MYSGTGSLRRNTAVPSSPVFCCKYPGRAALTKDTRTGLPAMGAPFLASIRCTTNSVAHNLGSLVGQGQGDPQEIGSRLGGKVSRSARLGGRQRLLDAADVQPALREQ